MANHEPPSLTPEKENSNYCCLPLPPFRWYQGLCNFWQDPHHWCYCDSAGHSCSTSNPHRGQTTAENQKRRSSSTSDPTRLFLLFSLLLNSWPPWPLFKKPTLLTGRMSIIICNNPMNSSHYSIKQSRGGLSWLSIRPAWKRMTFGQWWCSKLIVCSSCCF